MIKIRKLYLTRVTAGLVSAVMSSLLLCSCFTGVESTKKIGISREDKKLLRVIPEDTIMQAVKSLPLGAWHIGDQFIVTDNRINMLFDRNGASAESDTTSLVGRILEYRGNEPLLRPDGTEETVLLFEDRNQIRRYSTGKKYDSASTEVKSGNLPMLVSLKMVEEASRLLKGRELWIRTNLWYDTLSNRIKGKKFVKVTVTDVKPGTLVFPLRLLLQSEDGVKFQQLMNLGNNANDSRSFARLFRLENPKNSYPAITEQVWALIQQGKVMEGMTKDECRLSLGNPSYTDSGHDWNSTLDVWKYDDGTFLRFRDGVLISEP